MTETYQYTECGLDNVILVNGFELKGGGRLRICDIEGLHRAIGKWLVSTRKRLTGSEIRYLRHELELSQVMLANLLGVNERTVIRWEKNRGKPSAGNPAAERTLRLLYLEKAFGDSGVAESLELVANLEDRLSHSGEFAYSDVHHWQENMAA